MRNYGPDRDFIQLKKNDIWFQFIRLGEHKGKECYEVYSFECDCWPYKFSLIFDKNTSYKKMYDSAEKHFFNPYFDHGDDRDLIDFFHTQFH